MITSEQLKQIMPHLPAAKRELYLPFLNAAMDEFEITNELRAAAFLAQLAHESMELKYMEEIASGAAYEGRKDLGNTQPGDGRRYKGRGPIQLTGRANYRKAGKALDLPLEEHPQIATEPTNAFRIAGYFWDSHNLNALADARKFKAITKAMNGGYNGLDERVKYYERALRVLPDSLAADDTEASDLDEEEPSSSIKASPDKSVTTGDTSTSQTAGAPPPAPAVEIKASEPSWSSKIGSISLPAGVLAALGAVGKFVATIPPWAFSAIAITGLLIGAWLWNEAKNRAQGRTLKVMDAGAAPEKNNLRLI